MEKKNSACRQRGGGCGKSRTLEPCPGSPVGTKLSVAKPNHRVLIWKIPFSDHPGPTSIAILPHQRQATACGNTSAGLSNQIHRPGTSPGEESHHAWGVGGGRRKTIFKAQVSSKGDALGSLPPHSWEGSSLLGWTTH